jgi:asparagine synthetase B (glutamine-hydrolysing)
VSPIEGFAFPQTHDISLMGQFFLIQCDDPAARQRIAARAESLLNEFCGSPPSAKLSAGSSCLLLFGSRNKTAPLLIDPTAASQPAATGAILASVGVLFHDGKGGSQALQSLAGSLVATDNQTRALAWKTSLGPADGCFAIVAIERNTGKATLVTDRLGSLHVYRATEGECVAISTSALVLASVFRRGLDATACLEFLATGTVFENRSMFEGVEKLGPAAVIPLSATQSGTPFQYWDVKQAMYDRAPRYAEVGDLADSLSGAVATIARNFSRPILDLTGGFDSRAVLGAALRLSPEWNTVVVGPDDDADVRTANLIASKFRLQHHHLKLPEDWGRRWWERAKTSLALCDGEYDVLEYARILEHHTRLSADFDISINGSGGELCKGYWWELLYPFPGKRKTFDERRVAAGRFVFDPRAAQMLRSGGEKDIIGHFAGIMRRANTGLENYPNTAKMDNVYLTLRMQRWQGRIASSTMRVWPCVSPFLMREPMELAVSATPRTRVRNRMSRRLIEHFDPALAALPLAEGYPALPLRPSTMVHFAPLALEFGRKVLHRAGIGKNHTATRAPNPLSQLKNVDELRDALELSRMETRGLYDPARLADFLAGVWNDSFNRPSHLGRVLSLEMSARALKTHRAG